MQSYGLDIVVANDVSLGKMGTDENSVVIIDREGHAIRAEGKKSLIAGKIIDALVESMRS
jgi:phosphopantothenoylcysteine synthetase/decarboxylase